MRNISLLTLVTLAVVGSGSAAQAQSVSFHDLNGRQINTFRAGQTVIVRFRGASQTRFCGVWSQDGYGSRFVNVLWTGNVPANRTVDVRATAPRGHISITGGLYYSRFNVFPINTLWGGG